MDSNKSNKISDIVRLQQILKKWKKVAKNAPKSGIRSSASTSNMGSSATNSTSHGSKSIKFLKRTLSFTDVSTADVVPKGFLAVCVGKDLARFVIPTRYLRHPAFEMLLQEAEEEFGFQQQGVLKIPCEVVVFQKILKAVEEKRDITHLFYECAEKDDYSYGSSDSEFTPTHHPQLCR
ncbi:hypothetical protein MLD38_031540 [Melastoma candidum]|uniref:Uncharacterized protein n=1 Tax=Melastoma candidum TaxID=119954 RepID=A0ACB9MPE0_9MYRT|nr:hypothetical protein MLD38_031540 [Melastoma candidum]